MGGKSGVGRVLPGPFRHLPAGIRLSGLGVVYEADDWFAEIRTDSRLTTPAAYEAATVPPEFQEMRCRSFAQQNGREVAELDATAHSVALLVDGEPTRFDVVEVGDTWIGTAIVSGDRLVVSVSVSGLRVEEITIDTITDPSVYLVGQRRFMHHLGKHDWRRTR